MRRRCNLLVVLALVPLAGGCAALPPESAAVWVEDYCGESCESACGVAAAPSCASEEWPVDPEWDKFDRCAKRCFNKAFRPDLGYEPPPAVPLTPGTAGRFFPAPTQPAFTPQYGAPGYVAIAEAPSSEWGPRL